jgi:puromycin-sensitive aminopeptidase
LLLHDPSALYALRMAETSTPAGSDYRLPRSVLPRRYDLTLSPDIGRRDFVGSVTIAVDVNQPTRQIALNAKELEIRTAWIVGADGSRNEAATTTFNVELERVTFIFERPIEVGESKVHIEFTGILNDKLRGFYASSYTALDGSTKVIATSQLQSTDARRVFPCWDEPDCKAVFGITLVVDEGLLAVSNMSEIARSTMANRRNMVRFADTPVMSTYLVAFVVGEMETTPVVDVDGIPVRVIARPGQGKFTAFALEAAAFALRYFQDWYGIPYPGTKLDLIATPDFAFGAMENLGAVTFRETLLLADPETATRQDLENIATVVAHEIAHMWFGDLVTMSWWNGIWLNEAFATFAETSCTAKFRPEWEKWTTFSVDRAAAASVDGLHSTRPIEFPVISPSDAEGMFDVLTYEKGASVIRQLEQYLGEIPFRDGVRHYLNTHKFANTETTDLFDALEHVTGQPVRTLMDSWIFQGGYPIVNVALDSEANTVTFAQHPFTYLPTTDAALAAKKWSVPLLYRTEGAGGSVEQKLLLDTDSKSAPVPAGTTLVVGNSGGHGFYRVSYDTAQQSGMRASFASLPAIERFIVVSDLWASVLQGSATAERFLELTDTLGTERDLSVWRAVTGAWASLELVFDAARRVTLEERVRAVLGPIAAELGWEEAPGEAGLTGQLRGLVLTTLGTIGEDPSVIVGAAERIGAVLAETSDLPADVGAAVITIASSHGTDAQWQQFDAARIAASTPQANVRLLRALSMFPSETLAKQTLELMVGPTVRTQDAPYAIGAMATSRVTGPVAWGFLKSNWTKLNEAFPDNSIPRMISPFSAQSSSEIAADVRAFFAPGAGHEVPQAKKQLEQMLERLEINVGLRSRESAAPVSRS